MRSLRQTATAVRSGQSRNFGLWGTSLAAMCVAGVASAQVVEGDVFVLPTVDVETTEVTPTPAPVARAPRQAAAPRRVAAPAAPQVCTPELTGQPVCAAEDSARAQAAADAKAAADASAAAAAQARAGNNPYAAPNAGLRAQTLSIGKLPGEVRDMPRTVTAVTKEALETTGTTSVRELARSTPGISLGFGEGGNAFGDNLYIRGFKANNDVYVDGVRDPGTGVRETFNTEQVEVLKGPAGTVGGRGTTGGALNIATKTPQDVDFTQVSTMLTDAGTKRVTIDANRVVDDKFSYRLNGMLQDGEVAGRDAVVDDREGLSGAVRYKVSDALTLEGDYTYTRIEQTPDWGVPFITPDDSAPTAGLPTGPITEFGVDRDTFYGVKGRDYQNASSKVATGRAIWEIGNGMTLTNTLRTSSAINDYILTAPSSVDDNGSINPDDWTASLSFKSRYQETEVIADELELTGKSTLGGVDHSYVAGLHLSEERVATYGYDNLMSEDYQAPGGARGCVVSVTNPAPIAAGCWSGESAVLADGHTNTSVRTTSAYLLDTVTLTDKWAVNGGVRVDHYEVERDSYDGDGAVTSLSRTDTMWNWNGGVTYKPQKPLTVYGAIATSTNPMGQEIAAGGGFYGGLDDGGATLAPEVNTSLEVGVKYEYARDLLLTAALFRTTKDNAREDIGGRGNSVTYDSLKYQVQGLELGVAGKVHDKVGLYGGLVLMDTEVLDSKDPDAIGESVPNIASTQFNLLATYDVSDDLMLGLQSNYIGKRDLGSTYANGNTLPDSWSFDVVGSYAVTDNTDVRFGVTNLTDKTVYDAAYRSGEPFTYVAPGRELWAAVDFKF